MKTSRDPQITGSVRPRDPRVNRLAVMGSAGGGMPSADALAALRAWFEGLGAREAAHKYLGHVRADGQSSRGLISAIRQQLAEVARRRHRKDLEVVFLQAKRDRLKPSAKVAAQIANAIDDLKAAPPRQPEMNDPVGDWFNRRTAGALQAHGIETIAQLLVRVPRRKVWWRGIPRLGAVGAAQIEAFFAAHSRLTDIARAALVENSSPQIVVPWERIAPPRGFDGSLGVYRAPLATCTLTAKNDHEAVTAWLERHEAPATQRAYRKEAERLILWAILERGKPMSSLAAEDATAYRAFLRRPSPLVRWVGPARRRTSPEWKPFARALSPRSVSYALTVLSALYRWLVEQRYVLANPFSGLKVRGADREGALDSGRSFTEGEWSVIRVVADGLEHSYGWSKPAAQRLRFLIDFSYGTGLRASELVGARLGRIEVDAFDDHWLRLRGKGSKAGKVAMPPLVRGALDQYLVQRRLPTTPSKWDPNKPIIGRIDSEDPGAITSSRLWSIVRRFFRTVADVLADTNPALAAKLRTATTHWMRHTHATHALQRGVELTTVRDNLRHASISTTSTYLHGDDTKRARQIGGAFGRPA